MAYNVNLDPLAPVFQIYEEEAPESIMPETMPQVLRVKFNQKKAT